LVAKPLRLPVMRHVWTLIAALVIGPLAWILMAFGQDRSAQAFANAADSGSLHTADFIQPLLLLAGAGVVLGLIATLRFSPLGAVVAGVAYTATYATLLIAPHRLLDLLAHHVSVAGHRADLSTPIRTGTALLVGAMLLVATASVDRWRRRPRPTETTSDPTSEQDRPLGVDGLGLSRTFDDLDKDLMLAGSTSTAHAGAGSPRGGDFTRR
jgi:hypothetical protein